MLILFYRIQGNVTVNVTKNPILSSLRKCRRACLGVRRQMTLIIKHIVTYACPQFEISLTNQVNLIVLIYFYRVQGNVTVSVTYSPILESRLTSRRICPGVRM